MGSQDAPRCPHQAVLHSKRQPLGHASLAQHGSQPVPSDDPTPSQAPSHGVLKVRTHTHDIQGIQHVATLEAGTRQTGSCAKRHRDQAPCISNKEPS